MFRWGGECSDISNNFGINGDKVPVGGIVGCDYLIANTNIYFLLQHFPSPKCPCLYILAASTEYRDCIDNIPSCTELCAAHHPLYL